MERRTRDPEEALLSYLDRINARLRDLCEEDFVRNPDEFATQLEADSTRVQDAVDALVAMHQVPRSVDLNEIVDHACREFLLSMAPNIVINASKVTVLPGLPHSYELLAAAVLRALQLTAKHAGQGGELYVATSTDGQNDTVTVRSGKTCAARRGGRAARPDGGESDGGEAIDGENPDLDYRDMALSELVEGTGGDGIVRLGLDSTGAIVEMSLTFETRMATR